LLTFISTISSPPTCHVIAIWPLRPYHVITISLPYHSDLVTMSSPCHYQVTTMSLPRRSHVMTMYPEHRILIPINSLLSRLIWVWNQCFEIDLIDSGINLKGYKFEGKNQSENQPFSSPKSKVTDQHTPFCFLYLRSDQSWSLPRSFPFSSGIAFCNFSLYNPLH
jgi:hypothetical protein